MGKIFISGFADEISPDFDEQLRVVTELGMKYISLRTTDKKGIADYTAEEVSEKLLPRLEKAGVKVSSPWALRLERSRLMTKRHLRRSLAS